MAVQFIHCARDLLLHLKHSCITKFSLQHDLRSKVQHLQPDLRLKVQHLMILCTRGASLLFPFLVLLLLCYFTFKLTVVKLDIVFRHLLNSSIANV